MAQTDFGGGHFEFWPELHFPKVDFGWVFFGIQDTSMIHLVPKVACYGKCLGSP